MPEYTIGVLSGTSADGIDVALVAHQDDKPTLLASHKTPIATDLQEAIFDLFEPGHNEIDRLMQVDVRLGRAFADAVLAFLENNCDSNQPITAIGSHGQTLRHHGNNPIMTTLQIGDPNIISAKTGIPVVCDFRRADLANGGQGAPLAPLLHQRLFSHPKYTRAVVNIGGITNLTILNGRKLEAGFDTGPGNGLMDAWSIQHLQQPYDDQGCFARSGSVDVALLDTLLSDPYFQQAAPKSTGKETFNLTWLNKRLKQHPGIAAKDVQATLLELTARSIHAAIKHNIPQCQAVYVCGGGAHNSYLMERLHALCQCPTQTTLALGVDPDCVEAMLFAWLAHCRLHQQRHDLGAITGSYKPVLLGGVYGA